LANDLKMCVLKGMKSLEGFRYRSTNGRPSLFYINVLRVSPSVILGSFLCNVNITHTLTLSLHFTSGKFESAFV
jgi:hypothetical protein